MAELYEREWPTDNARGGVVIVHGLGEHSGRYDYVARALNAAGYAVFAQDVRGHGKSVGFPGDMGPDFQAPINDVVEQCVAVRTLFDRVFLLAHSMGTLISLPAVPKVPTGTLAGLICSGTALEPGPAGADLATGSVPVETLSRDPAVQQAYTDDPLVWDTVPIEVLGHALEAGQLASDAIPLIDIPVLIVHGVDDQLTSIQGAERLQAELVVTDKTFIGYPGLRHEILNEPERDKVIADIVAWLDKH